MDTGTGIPPELLTRIFEPFFTTKAAGKGTGLGLSTVYAVVEEARGGIHVTSVPGRTEFILYFPATDELPLPVESDAPITRTGAVGTVLLAEDEPAVRAAVARLLTARGWKVIEAADGNDAVERGLQHIDEIDVLVSDVVMPGMPVRDVTSRLRAARPGLRIVFISGYPGDALSDRAIPDGIELVSKPINAANLFKAIDRAGRRATLP